MPFSWVPFYREVVQEVLKYENRQDELLALLGEMKAANLPVIPLEEDKPDGTMAPLYEIDPFSFMSNLARVELPQFIKICTFLKSRWKLESAVPSDYDGRIGSQARGGGSWFFTSLGYKDGRGPEDIGRLWTLARQAFNAKAEDLNPELFALCMGKNSGIRKLTNGLSWLSPKGFLPLGEPMLDYLKANGVEYDARAIERRDLEAYRGLMKNAHGLNYDNLALVKAAQEWKKSNPLAPSAPPSSQNQFPLNQILYGPPGTGKTWNTVNRAVEIIDGAAPPDRDECKARFDALRALGQIEFVTFHQSFGYEEFIEGLRPLLDEDGEGAARYEIRDGLLKELALRAIGAGLEKTVSGRPTFDELWSELLATIENSADYRVAGLSNESAYSLSVTSRGNLQGINTKSDKGTLYSCPRRHAETVWNALRDAPKITSTQVHQLIGNSHTNLIGAVVEELKGFISQQLSGKRETNSILAPDAALSFLKGSSDYRAAFPLAPRFVLIVDEINRGNISKILGELITLLEDDKRLGGANELRVKLPISGDSFALPPNLFLLGTMNTADKSLALLDIALRRRFDFEEMPPRAELFPDFARETLQTLNLRIEAALDREHRLGHAFFIGCEGEDEFGQVFRAKIIPLLQEFFFNDWETLRAVLGESGNGTFIKALPSVPNLKSRTKWRWWFDGDGALPLNPLAALRANYARTGGSVEEDGEGLALGSGT